ncbi:MAG: hotdog domain-containing protein [Alphaproteobacteria bacterium]
MRTIPVGHTFEVSYPVLEGDTGHALGNTGVTVLGTPALIKYMEMSCGRALPSFLDDGEGSVATRVDIEHLAPAPLGAEVVYRSEVADVARNKVTFAVTAHLGETLLMRGRHIRAVLDMTRFRGDDGAD